MPSHPLAAGAGVVAAVVVAAGALTLLPGAAPEAAAEGLVPYDSCGDLLEQYRTELARTATPWGFGHGIAVPAFARQGAGDSTTAAGESATGGAVGSGPTGTNLQEQGVDEPDIAKLVGDLLYAVSENRLQVVRTGPQPQLLGSARLGEQGWGGELLVDDDRILVLVPQGAWDHPGASDRIAPTGPAAGTTSALLLDVSDPTAPRLLEELQVEGRYLSARLSEGAVRLVTTSSPQPESAQPQAPHGQAEQDAALAENRERARGVGLADVLPEITRRGSDGTVLSSGQAVDCRDVRHPAASPTGASTLLVTTLDLRRGLAPRDSTAVTTDGEIVYASADRLYVATSRWGTTAPDDGPTSDTTSAHVRDQVTTELHAFDTSVPDRTSYAGSGSVPGYVLGRWALSSYDGHLRVATTSSPPWQGGAPSSSTVTVLAEREDGLVQVGRVGDLGVGERIFAVRYFGHLATVVTFRQTDPLYVLDLAAPSSPKLLGELKIPGFSTYLHPVGDDLLLGVGQDADLQGRVTGMQVSLFDLSDLSEPKQVDRLPLGRGWSPAGEESRAFGYDPRRRIALLPFSVWDPTPTSAALGIRVEGHRLVEAGRMPVPPENAAERVLHDGHRFYSVSRRGVVAGSFDTFDRTGEVVFAAEGGSATPR